uniref:Uncharacterized protein n=1 Tax=Siphoviridae sp. ct3es5 TaxID=2825322 RepID=A0A8S5PVJ8_9CAUD|nr:MAG TPA: hypothetical protein [Siphoviridae sp. ct3es5]
MLLPAPIFRGFRGLKCSVFRRFGALRSIKIHGIIQLKKVLSGKRSAPFR